MARSAALLRKALFPLMVALTMGFGASQALASPQQPSETAVAACSASYCDSYCIRRGYAEGWCDGVNCHCYEW